MVFVNVAKGFRSGALQSETQASAADVALGLPPGTIPVGVKPDSLWTYELGTRWELADRSVILEAGAYHTDWSDVLVQFATSALISLANGGNAEVNGFDAGVVWRTPVDGLTLSVSGNVNKTKFTEVVGALSAGTAIAVGAPIPNVPRKNLALAANYKANLDWFGGVTGSLYAGYAYRGSQFDATVKGLETGQLNDVTLRAGLQKGKFTVELYALNAANDDDPAALTSTALQILYPRRIGLKFSCDF
jgi:outer membrane receptor protein involved in Fe transport